MERQKTPPAQPPSRTRAAQSPPTPEVARRIEENRLRAKAIRQRLDEEQRSGSPGSSSTPLTRKRTHDAISSASSLPASSRDGRANGVMDPPAPTAHADDKSGGAIRPVNKKFAKYVDYNLSSMTDTRGGFLSTEDDPFNPVLHSAGKPGDGEEKKPDHMTQKEWERHQLLKKLRAQKTGQFEPGISILEDKEKQISKRCRECKSLEIDAVWLEVFHIPICSGCREKYPEKYSLLTKTECKEDYLLTDSELRDPELLPHLSKPNPHKSHWHDMMLFLRFQVEDYALKEKWGSGENLDKEFEKRETDKKQRKEKKFREKLEDLKKKTRTDAYRRQRGVDVDKDGTVGPKKFGDRLGGGKHVHEWGNTIEKEDGMTVRTCTGCGMEVEEMVF
ncbi:hypothetical protein MKZ38_002301 [Zalerion maritima]|uniref:DNA repair protein RAD14 n=1 Tax=Zalerion maritima TaxID=339359 RepID=A0AAD5RP43_9PEZI|nr:hypothetical protein MKZ38_002301 [Zalerion maritima]